jgi:aspartate racemase
MSERGGTKGVHIGLIGGIGVAATLVYYQRLAAAVTARGATMRLTLAHGDIQSLIRHNLADDRAAQARIFADLTEGLAAAGCDCVALTSIGAHFCVEEFAALSALPVVSGVAPLDAYFAAQGIGKVGLLGTRGVMRSQLYGLLHLTEAVVLADEIEHLGQSYQDLAVAGECSEEQRYLFVDAGRRMVEDLGAEAIVLAGTDLNLAFDGADPGYNVIDALDVHVAVLADLATGQRSLQEAAMT